VSTNSGDGRKAVQLHLVGVVQGVGFRPFVHRLAMRHGLGGWVRNEAGEVRIEVEGPAGEIAAFRDALVTEAPPLARIDSLEQHAIDPSDVTEFEVMASDTEPRGSLPISPDVAMCGACEVEFFDAADRRYRYPFITCTDCGPRYTVIEEMPYDRERTSMRAFQQCEECLREYRTPSDRRYHSETNSCPDCGPRIWFETAEGDRVDGEDAIEATARALRSGWIVALRGLGGFHLAVDATDDAAVQRLRRRKAREAKPLALMVRTIDDARALGAIGPEEERLLGSSERPIVLLRERGNSPVAPSVSPGLDTIGVMTAYTPLHHLVLDGVRRPLVMTSGNVSEEPIATGNDEARQRLAGIADAFLLHDREIVSRYDDSVVRVVDETPVFLRRARGYAPLPVLLPFDAPVPIVAVGPHLKNTFALASDRNVYVSQHIGDMENLETLDHFEITLERYRKLFRVEPEIAVRDLHPGYMSTQIAEAFGFERVIAVQHHHAHVAAVAAEHGVTEPVVGLSFDGTGYGDDGNVWGAEVLVADLAGYQRVGRLRYAPLPGGDLAIRRPWRVALGYLWLEPGAAAPFARAFEDVPERERRTAQTQIERSLNAPLASSLGRLFDAAAAVLGVRRVAHYEGQAAMELEALAGSERVEPLVFPARDTEDGLWELDPVPLLVALGERRAAGEDVQTLAARFHESVAATSADLASRMCERHGCDAVALGGGCFQNDRLLSSVRERLEAAGRRVLVPCQLSPNDGAISYGQAVVAAELLRRERGA
jgi:hydrogenase maturation protein HypF